MTIDIEYHLLKENSEDTKSKFKPSHDFHHGIDTAGPAGTFFQEKSNC